MIKKNLLKLKYPILLLISVGVIAISFYFRAELASLGKWGLLGIFLINIIGSATLFIPAPAIATVVAGGVVFNPLLVAVVAALGSAIGDMIGFVLGRSGEEILFKKKSFKYNLTKDLFKQFGGIAIIIFSFVPNPFFDGIGIIAGIFAFSPKKFFIYTLLGRFFRNLLLAYLGSSF